MGDDIANGRVVRSVIRGVYGCCEDRRKTYEFAAQSRAILGLAKILEAPRIEDMGVRFLASKQSCFRHSMFFCNPACEVPPLLLTPAHFKGPRFFCEIAVFLLELRKSG
jgi:hypothetical protein